MIIDEGGYCELRFVCCDYLHFADEVSESGQLKFVCPFVVRQER